jgi:glycosyltransferase involved in cell wall biosynthesis
VPDKKFRTIFFTESAGGACARYRALLPAQALNEAGYYARTSTEWVPKMLDEFDIFVFQRINQKEGLLLIEELNSVNKLTIYDMDDDLLDIPKSSPVYQLMLEHLDMIGAQVMAMTKSKAVTVTTEFLKNRLVSLSTDVHVLPNLIRTQSWEGLLPLRYADPDSVVLGWAGSNTHRDALEMLEEPLRYVIDKYPNTFLVVMGDELPFKFPTSRYVVIPWGKYRVFQSVLLGWDIGLAPLGRNRFNLSKSNLRILEIGTAGKPCVATKWGEYTSTIITGENGFLCNDTQEWIINLSFLIEKPDQRRQMGSNLRAHGERWGLYTGIQKRIDLYEKLLGQTHANST